MSPTSYAAAVVAVLALAGCATEPAGATDHQTANWKELAQETIPAASAVTVESGTVPCGGRTCLAITVDMELESFADLAGSEQAILDFREAVLDEEPDALLLTNARTPDTVANEAEISSQLVRDVAGVTDATVSIDASYFDFGQDAAMWGNLQVYVDDTSVLSPSWLDEVATIAHEGLAGVDTEIGTIAVLPASAVNLAHSDPMFAESVIPLAEQQSFKDAGEDGRCVRTDSWGFDLNLPTAYVYSQGEQPGPLCP